MPNVMTVGVDVSKNELVIAQLEGKVYTLENRPAAIKKWLATLHVTILIGAESTGNYHQDLARLAIATGHRLYLLDARRLSAYRKAIGTRAKTDRCDAELMARYLSQEHSQLHPYTPPAPHLARLQSLLRRRARVVQARVRLEATLKGCTECRGEIRSVMRSLTALLKKIDLQTEAALSAHPECATKRERLRSIPGVGALVSVGLHVTMEKTPYRNSDALVAAIGLDPRANDSGQHRGRRRLTKRGSSEMRRLLYLAAVAAIRKPGFRSIYDAARNRGLRTVGALIIVARKILRIAYVVHSSGAVYEPGKLRPA